MRAAGFDMGHGTIRLAVVNGGLKGFKLEFAAARIAAGDADRLAAIRHLTHEAHAGAYPSAIEIPVHLVSARTVTLPFTDRAKLAAVLPFELEGQLPFELDEVVVDGVPVSHAADHTRVLAAAVPKATLQTRLDEAGRAGLDPRVVTVDAAALAAAAAVWLAAHQYLVLVHVDTRSISVALIEQGRLRGMRGLAWEGENAMDEVGRRLGLDPDEALTAAAHGGTGSDGAAIAAAVAPELEPVFDELRRTLRADALESGLPVEAVAISGQWSTVAEVGDLFAGALGLARCEWPALPVAGRTVSLAPWALAAGLAVTAVARDRLDFRRGAFAYGRERAGIRRRLISVGLLSIFVLMAGAVDLGVRLMTKERRYADVQTRVRSVFHEVLPGAPAISEPDQLGTAIAALTKQRAFLGGGLGVLDVLLAMTDAIPKESGIAVSDLVIDHDKVRIEAETNSFDWVNRIESALAKSPMVQAITVSDAKTTADQSKIRFLMTITLKEGL
ncbi:MAG: type II secretion system protein GspL [Nitrospiria bacterium]